MHDAELLFLVNRFRHVLSGLCLAGCEAVSDVALSPVVHLGRSDGDSGKMELAGEGSRAVLTALNLRGCKGLTEVCLSQLLTVLIYYYRFMNKVIFFQQVIN